MQTVEYDSGRLADVFGGPADPAVLLWHGQQSNARASVRSLAGLIAQRSFRVIASDWDSHADDGGRSDLLASLHFARGQVGDPDGLTLVGWSMGGLAAAALTLRTQELGVTLAHTVCLEGAFMVPDPLFNELPATQIRPVADPVPFTLLHGTADRVIPLWVADDFGAALRSSGWPVEVVELAVDHGSIAGASYDEHAGRYHAATDEQSLAIADDVAARIADAARQGR